MKFGGVYSGCVCKPGFNGSIIAVSDTINPLGYTGACVAVLCPAFSHGSSVADGCTCNAGYIGTIKTASTSPYFDGSCSAAPCPIYTNTSQFPADCKCVIKTTLV